MIRRPTQWTAAIALALTTLLAHPDAAAKDPPTGCNLNTLEPAPAVTGIAGPCPILKAGTYKFDVINIIGPAGELSVDDSVGGTIDIWARAIIVENGGKLRIGTPTAPIGSDPAKKTKVVIHLYGPPTKNHSIAVLCNMNPSETCGAPMGIWNANLDGSHNPKKPAGQSPLDCKAATTPEQKAACVTKVKDLQIAGDTNNGIRDSYPGVKDDYFYGYHGLFADDGMDSEHRMGYFGTKVLAVSYGGTLQMFGKKGAIYAADTACNPGNADSTGRSWVRLAKTAPKDSPTITVTKPACDLDWVDGDDIVITTTDYLPTHSEQRKVSGAPKDNGDNTVTITLDAKLAYHHNGDRFSVSALSGDESEQLAKLGLKAAATGAETRAAVGLLSRSIRIVSEGCALNEHLPDPGKNCAKASDSPAEDAYFGGHTVFRQGLASVQIQGVEFYQMGQGGRLGHYPVHFHHARKTQNGAVKSFVQDSSIWDSMTRWVVLHGTSDVTVARNVGYKSIGHGFYLEDGTEINNALLANLGVFARPAVDNGKPAAQDQVNPRKVPGILAAGDIIGTDAEFFPAKSDIDHPTVFWIMNGWNDFQYNMAAGAGTCGACYWFVSGVNSGMSKDMKWESYASMQSVNPDRAGITPLKSFMGNSCTTAMTSFQTVTATEPCKGVAPAKFYGDVATLLPIKNSFAPLDHNDKTYFPDVHATGGRFGTRCGGVNNDANADCSTATLQPVCSAGNPKDCMVTVLDHYTSSFNWAAFNFAAIWLRPQWYLLTDSVITDVQQAGLTMVTGGGYSESDVIPGHWALTRNTLFVGSSQPEKPTVVKDSAGKERTISMPDNPYASNGGPFNPASNLRCAQFTNTNRPGDFCLSVDDGISFQTGNAFAVYQRLFSVYDGPAYQDSNAYVNIKERLIDDCKPLSRADPNSGICDPPDKTVSRGSSWWAGFGPNGLPRRQGATEADDTCYMPNAAIGWKQPNGFYYPPAFHSTNLFFKNVDYRHFVVTPLFQPGTLVTDIPKVGGAYCSWNNKIFASFTSIDRQTVLNDDDGSLTGYTGPGRPSIVVNLDDFFAAPVEAIQCRSDKTSRTSPYAYVTTVLYPHCATNGTCAVDPGEDPSSHIKKPNPHTGDWDQACSNENCYGIPLYRLDVNKSDKGVPPSIRMAGQATGQRSTLTVNNGLYYIDTAVDRTAQLVYYNKDTGKGETCNVPTVAPGQECNINVFQKGQTYYVLLIYAKEDTQQTYRFFVGPGTTDDPATEAGIQLIQSKIEKNPITFSAGPAIPKERVRWANKANGIVEVTLKAADFTGIADKFTAAKKAECQPASFCAWDDKETDKAKMCKQCLRFNSDGTCATGGFGTADVCKWAIADPHCPEGGCIGFKFTMPAGFSTGHGPDGKTMGSNMLCSNTAFRVDFATKSDGVCPAAADNLKLNFTDVTPTNCQDSGVSAACTCP